MTATFAMERRIADLESTTERLLERIAELEAANRLLASGVSPGYWRAGSRLASREQAAQSDSALPPPTELGEPKRPRA